MRHFFSWQRFPVYLGMLLFGLMALPILGMLLRFPNLKEADRAASPFTALGGQALYHGDGMAKFNGAAGIYGISLSGEKVVDDAALARLRMPLEDLPKLDTLFLVGTRITDAGLPTLEGLPNLRELYLDDTQVTAEGVAKLKAELPDCQIHFGQE